MAHRFIPNARYDHPDDGDDPTNDPFVQCDIALTKRISDVLERHYFGHPWLVEVSHAQGVAMLSIPLFMGQWKHVLHLRHLKSDPGLRSIVRAGGEILERYRIPRQKFAADHFVAALEGIPIRRRATHGVIPD